MRILRSKHSEKILKCLKNIVLTPAIQSKLIRAKIDDDKGS